MAAKKTARGNSGKTNGNGANLRFEAKLSLAADLSAANCNHVLPPCRGLQSFGNDGVSSRLNRSRLHFPALRGGHRHGL